MAELEPCKNCGNTTIAIGKMKEDGLWHGVCLACRTYVTTGSKTKTQAKDLWNHVMRS